MCYRKSNRVYFHVAMHAFYRNPYSDLLIISEEAFSRASGAWKHLNVPFLVVTSDGNIPEATKREIMRRKGADLYIWGNATEISEEVARQLSTFTKGDVYRVVSYAAKTPVVEAVEENKKSDILPDDQLSDQSTQMDWGNTENDEESLAEEEPKYTDAKASEEEAVEEAESEKAVSDKAVDEAVNEEPVIDAPVVDAPVVDESENVQDNQEPVQPMELPEDADKTEAETENNKTEPVRPIITWRLP